LSQELFQRIFSFSVGLIVIPIAQKSTTIAKSRALTGLDAGAFDGQVCIDAQEFPKQNRDSEEDSLKGLLGEDMSFFEMHITAL
jgi:hypothetical protein